LGWLRNDRQQSPPATLLIESLHDEDQGFISLVVLAEFHWVAHRMYRVCNPMLPG